MSEPSILKLNYEVGDQKMLWKGSATGDSIVYNSASTVFSLMKLHQEVKVDKRLHRN